MNLKTRWSFFTVLLAVFLAMSPRISSANPEYWTDADGSGVWPDDGAWFTYYTAARQPQAQDVVYFNTATVDTTLRMNDITTPALQSIYFQGTGNGFTIGLDPGDGTVTMEGGWAIVQQANLVGSGMGSTFNSNVELQDYEVIANFSPAAPITTVPGEVGSNNALTFAGGITKDNGAQTAFYGTGDIVVSGDFVNTHGGDLNSDMTGTGTLVLSGNNNITSSNVRFGGNVVLDYTTNNTAKLPTGNNVAIGYAFTNYNGNVAANGGHMVIDANQDAATNVTFGGTTFQTSSTLVVNGASDGVTATTVNLGYINSNTYGSALDLTTNGNVQLYTNNTNAGTYGAQTLIMNQQITFDKSYFAQAGGNTFAQSGNGGYGSNTTPVLITPLINDNGSDFNSQWNEYHVASEASDVQTLTPDGNNQTGADTFRFTSANDPLGGVTSAHTLDLGGSDMYMAYGGIMVTQAVTGDTTVRDGTIHGGINGLSIINYSSGTLNISANIAAGSFGVNGGGTVMLSGNNEAGSSNYIISLNDGKVVLGSATALGTSSQLDMGSATSVLDLNGNSASVSRLLSDYNYVPGNAAAAVGQNTNIENTKAGTVSVLQIAGNPGINDSYVSTTNVYQDNNLGEYYGGLSEASGAILSLDIEQGTAANQVQFILGTANPFGDATGGDGSNISGVQGPATVFSGAVVVGTGANLALSGYGNIETLGVTNLNGLLGARANQAGNYGTTYLTGNGQVVGGNRYGFGISSVGSVADTFTGTFGTANVGTAFMLQVGGTGAFTLANAYYGNNGLTVAQDATLNMPTISDGVNATAVAHGVLNFTSPTATMNSNLYLNGGGTIQIAPTGSGQAVTVTNTSGYIGNNNNGSLVLNAGQNTSLTYEMGNQNSQAHFEETVDNSFSLGVTQGLSALGTTTQMLVQSNSAIMGEAYNTNLPNNILGTSFYARDDSANGRAYATFLQISNTANANVYSLTAYAYDAAHTNNVNAAGLNDIELVSAGSTYTYTQGNFDPILGLQIDKGGVLQNNGDLTLGNYNYGFAGLILNGGKILGNGLNLYRATSVYTDLDGGEIQNFNVSGQDLTKNGAGTLLVDNVTGLGNTVINQGVLDMPTLDNSSGLITLNGGILQVSSSVIRTLGTNNGDLNWATGGLAARQSTPGAITVMLKDSNNSSNLVWGVGGSNNFLSELGTMDFGSSTANSAIFFENNLNLGLPEGGSSGQEALYTRVINVTAGTADAGRDSVNDVDEVVMDGVISGSDAYVGLAKGGTGTLFLNGANTYTGATMISQGTVEFSNDKNLGAAPAAAYALNATPGVQGNALTSGAIEINGGAQLAYSGAGLTQTLSSNRQILLASGTDGSNAAQIYTADPNGYSTLNFGGIIADYVGEKGSLVKMGPGTLNYSGTAYNTGSYSVVGGTLEVSGAGAINSASGVTINNTSTDAKATAQFNYASTVALNKTVSYGAGGGVFAYNSAAAYTGATSLTLGSKQVLAGAGNMGLTAVTVGLGGTLTPGNVNTMAGVSTPGALTLGAVTLLNGGNYNFILGDASGVAGTGYSTVLASSVDLSALSDPFSINLSAVGAGGLAGMPLNFNPNVDSDFVLFSTSAGGITALTQDQLNGDFVVNTLPTNGANGDTTTGTWEVVENDANSQLLLHFEAAPEPSTWAMLAGGLGLLVFIRRLRHRSA